MKKSVLGLLYIPTYNCNLRCSYCYVHQSDVTHKPKPDKYFLSIDKNTIYKDINFLKEYAQKNNLLYNFYLHGGEPLLINADMIEYIIKEMIPYTYKDDNKNAPIAIQTNLTLLNDEILDVFIRNREYVSISTTLDLPMKIHNKYRCNSYNIVYNNIIKLLEKDIYINSLLGIYNETVENIKKFDKELKQIRNNTKHYDMQLRLLIGLIVGDNFTLTDKNQKIFANYLIENDLINLYINRLDSCCIFGEYCSIVTFSKGYFNFCHKLMNNILPDTIIQPIKKDYPKECNNCSVLKYCYGGCPADRLMSQNDKSPFCTFNKMIINNYIKRYGEK